MYTSIDIDFDVYKEITIRRKGPDVTENDVLREEFGLEPKKGAIKHTNGTQASPGVPWVSKGVTFPHGTDFRAEYGGQAYYARVDNGALVYDGKRYTSPSPAAIAVTGSSTNGWIFWECKKPGNSGWTLIDELRKN
ncbi:MAG TPA: DUF2924 domain-containing protein [Rhodothermales bacterium]|nr:DUF2924 domain-containing protein [Rhodothermales bacterium]